MEKLPWRCYLCDYVYPFVLLIYVLSHPYSCCVYAPSYREDVQYLPGILVPHAILTRIFERWSRLRVSISGHLLFIILIPLLRLRTFAIFSPFPIHDRSSCSVPASEPEASFMRTRFVHLGVLCRQRYSYYNIT